MIGMTNILGMNNLKFGSTNAQNGFTETWISWIMPCVISVSYYVLLNGDPKSSITPTRSLRQWDLLSPQLLILCTEVLISNLRADR